MKTVHQMFIRSPCPPTLDRIVKTTVLIYNWPEIFGTSKMDLNYFVRPVLFPAAFNSDCISLLYREGWRTRAKVMKNPVYASLPLFLKTFWAKLDFLSRNIYHFLSEGDCHHRNWLVSVVFKPCKRIISPIRMTSFYITTHDKIHEYNSVFWLRLERTKAPNYTFLGIWKGFGIILWKKGQDVNRRWVFRL